MKRRTQIQIAIDQLEAERTVLDLAIARLKQAEKKKADEGEKLRKQAKDKSPLL